MREKMPAYWKQRTIGELCSKVTSGGTPSRSVSEYYRNGHILWVKTAELRDAYIYETEERITAAAIENSSAKVLPVGTVLMAMYGATVGSLGILGVPASCNQAACAMIVDESLCDSRWLFYALLNDRDRIVSRATGAAQQNLSGRSIREFSYAVPPLAEQRAIADVLGALDDKIASNSALAKTADELARALFSESVRGVEVSDRTFDDVASVGGGGTPSSKVAEYWGGDINWATPTDVTALEGPYLFDTERRISEVGLANCSSPLYPAGSILMTSRATIGAFAWAQEATAVNQGFIVVVPGGDVPAMWLFHEMRSRVPEFTSMANGATFLELSRGNFKKFGVRLADPAVMARFDEQATALHDRAAAALKENACLKAARDALLPGLMSGKLRVRDAERIAEKVP